MLRILEVITLGEIGGAQTVLVDLVKGISDWGCQAEIDVVCGPGQYLPQALSPWFRGRFIQMPWLCRSISPFNDLKALKELWKLCRIRKYDIVHCHSSKASWLGRLAAYFAGIPKIYMTVHGLSYQPVKSPFIIQTYKLLEKLASRFATEYVLVSAIDIEAMQQLGVDKVKCRLIPNGRPAPVLPKISLNEMLGIRQDEPIICMVARLTEIKNPVSFIRIAKLVIDKYSSTATPRFVLIGDGPLQKKCQEEIARNNLSNLFYLLGNQENAGQYFWNSDVAVLTSNYEACPLVAIEAMATGTPVVASDVGGTKHVVHHGETGYIYSLNDEEEAAGHIVSLLTNPYLREKMSKTAIEQYLSRFTVERMVDEYIRLFGLEKTGA